MAEDLLDEARVDDAVLAGTSRLLRLTDHRRSPGTWTDRRRERGPVAAQRGVGARDPHSCGGTGARCAWREAHRTFGATAQLARGSIEALTRRARLGLPGVNRLTGACDAASVDRQVPHGGEDPTGSGRPFGHRPRAAPDVGVATRLIASPTITQEHA